MASKKLMDRSDNLFRTILKIGHDDFTKIKLHAVFRAKNRNHQTAWATAPVSVSIFGELAKLNNPYDDYRKAKPYNTSRFFTKNVKEYHARMQALMTSQANALLFLHKVYRTSMHTPDHPFSIEIRNAVIRELEDVRFFEFNAYNGVEARSISEKIAAAIKTVAFTHIFLDKLNSILTSAPKAPRTSDTLRKFNFHVAQVNDKMLKISRLDFIRFSGRHAIDVDKYATENKIGFELNRSLTEFQIKGWPVSTTIYKSILSAMEGSASLDASKDTGNTKAVKTKETLVKKEPTVPEVILSKYVTKDSVAIDIDEGSDSFVLRFKASKKAIELLKTANINFEQYPMLKSTPLLPATPAAMEFTAQIPQGLTPSSIKQRTPEFIIAEIERVFKELSDKAIANYEDIVKKHLVKQTPGFLATVEKYDAITGLPEYAALISAINAKVQ